MERIRRADHDAEAITLELEGELDMVSGETLMRAVRGVLDQGAKKVRIDLSPTTFVDSAGLAALVRAAGEVRERRGEVHVACPQGSEARVFIDLAGVGGLLGLT